MTGLDFVNPVIVPGGDDDKVEPAPTTLQLSEDKKRGVCPHPKLPDVLCAMIAVPSKNASDQEWNAIQIGILWTPQERESFLATGHLYSVLDSIRTAPSIAILDSIMEVYSRANADLGTKRKWITAANVRHKVLEAGLAEMLTDGKP